MVDTCVFHLRLPKDCDKTFGFHGNIYIYMFFFFQSLTTVSVTNWNKITTE